MKKPGHNKAAETARKIAEHPQVKEAARTADKVAHAVSSHPKAQEATVKAAEAARKFSEHPKIAANPRLRSLADKAQSVIADHNRSI